ncbi:Fatty acid synthase 3 [Carabus blaptoides fortunei]
MLEKGNNKPIKIMVQQGTGNFEINDRYGVVASGRILTPENFDKEIMEMPAVESNEDYFKFESNDFYSEFQDRRYQFSGPFRTVKEVNLFDEGITSKIEWKQSWATFVCSMIQLHMLHAGEDEQSLLIPNFIRRIAINFEQLPTSEQVLDVSYNYATKLIKSTAIQIHDIHYQAIPVAQKHLIADKTTFMKYAFNNIPDLQTGLDICVRIVQKSLKTGGIQITEIIDNNAESLTVHIKKISERSAGSKHGLANNLNWQEGIHAVAQSLNYSKRESQKLEQAMNFVKNKFQRIIQYKPSDKLVNGLTRLLRPQDSSKDYSYNILKYCNQVKIEIIKGNHFTMLQTDALAEYVNKNAIRRKFYQ